MANSKHVEIVRQGAEAIAEFRKENPRVHFDLHGADLSRAKLSRAKLRHDTLRGYKPRGYKLRRDTLRGYKLWRDRLRRDKLRSTKLRSTMLSGADLSGANLSGANLSGANLSGANLSGASLSGANLSGATCKGADFRGAILTGANLKGIKISGADLMSRYLHVRELLDTSRNNAKRDFPRELPRFDEVVRMSSVEPKLSVGSLCVDERLVCTIFAPPVIPAGNSLMVQVWAHTPAQTKDALIKAMRYDDDAEVRGETTLMADIKRGNTLDFELSVPGIKVDQRRRLLVWQGEPASVQFRVVIPKNHVARSHHGTITIRREQIPIGEIVFKLLVTESGITSMPMPIGQPRSFESYFVSYASADRVKVLERVQMLTRLGKKYFMDVLRLEPGDLFGPTLYQRIDESDAVLLFWSSNAKKSEWVMRECRYTISHKGIGSIHPVIIEGPPPVEPPPELQELHMNDPLLYVIYAESEVAKSRASKRGEEA